MAAIASSALIASAAPTVVALYIANEEAFRGEKALAQDFAFDVLERSDEASRQILDGIDALRALDESDPCGPLSISLMRQIDLSSRYIQAIGRVSGTELSCSSLGLSGPSTDLGPVDFTQPTGVRIRTNVTFPFALDANFLVVETNGYAAIIHKSLPIDTALDRPDVALAAFSSANGEIFTSRNDINPDWIAKFLETGKTSFIADGYIVSILASDRYLLGGLAAFPAATIEEQVHSVARRLVPVAIIAGVLLAIPFAFLARRQRELPAVIRAGLRRNEFYLEYQPVVDLETGRWVGAEALVRWRRSNGEMIRPDIFIPVAEEHGLITRITRRVVGLLAQDADALLARHSDFHFAVNIAPEDLLNDEILSLIDDLVTSTGVNYRNIIVEITERSFTEVQRASSCINELRKRGVRVAIDDFGTGYSSLSVLETLDLDFLKIDKSFVRSAGTEAATSGVIAHIIEIAKSLDLKLIAEGVESQQQADFLRRNGVEFAQGAIFAMPMSFQDLMARLARQEQEALAKA